MNLTTRYMGLTLRNPIIASASPLNSDLLNIKALEAAGAGAVVLPSIFAEQIEAETKRHDRLTNVGMASSPEATSYFPDLDDYTVEADRYLDIIRSAKQIVTVPVIASLNAANVDGWKEYAKQIESAGADALELNIYFIPSDLRLTGLEVERRYCDIVRAVKAEVSVPVAVKIGPYFSAPGHMAVELVEAGADALVLFNRFYQPDIDPVRLKITHDLDLSRSADMRLPLLWIAILHGQLRASLAATTGVHSANDVIKYLLAGADVVMTTSALLEHGVGHMGVLTKGLADWLDQRDMTSLEEVRGLLSQNQVGNPEAYERANYIKILQGYEVSPH